MEKQGDLYKTLIDYCIDVPFTFAIWENQGEVVLTSTKMQSLIKSNSLIISSIDFVKYIKNIFGNFLYDAVNKMSYTQFSNSKYSSIVQTNYNKTYTLTLYYNIKTQVYTMTVVDTTVQNNTNFETEYKVLQEIVDNIPIYIWRKNNKFKLIYCNKKYAETVNFSQNEVIEKNIQLFRTPNTNAFTHSNSIQQFSTRIKLRGEDKKFKVTEYCSTGKQLVGFALEFIEANIPNSNTYREQILHIINNIPEGVAAFNNNMQLLFINKSAIKIFSLDNFDVNNKTYSEIIDFIILNEIFPKSNKEFRDKLLSIFTNTIDEPVIKTIQLNNDKTIRISIIPNNKGSLLFLFSDLSNSLTLERELNSTIIIYQSILNNISDGIIIFGSDNRIRFANTSINDIFDKKNKQFEETHIRDFFEYNRELFIDSEILSNFILQILNSSEQRISQSGMMNLKNNRTINYSYIPIPNGLHLLKFKDISNYKSLESELKSASDKVDQIINLKNNLIITIADEYTAPLNTIRSFAEILCNQYFGNLNDKQIEYCSGIIKTTGYLKDIAEAIGDIALIQTDQLKLNFVETNIASFIKTIVTSFNTMEKNIQLIIDCKDMDFKVYIDNISMKKVLYQIISRSIYMIDSTGIIQITIKQLENNPDYFEIVISDDGCGISIEELAQYQKYFLSDPTVGEIRTIDIGYVLANYIVRLHNGKITIESEEEKGTVIKIQLPVNQFLV